MHFHRWHNASVVFCEKISSGYTHGLVNRWFWPLEGGREGGWHPVAASPWCRRQASLSRLPKPGPFFQGGQPSQTREEFPLGRALLDFSYLLDKIHLHVRKCRHWQITVTYPGLRFHNRQYCPMIKHSINRIRRKLPRIIKTYIRLIINDENEVFLLWWWCLLLAFLFSSAVEILYRPTKKIKT